jgi:hypothetical protein
MIWHEREVSPRDPIYHREIDPFQLPTYEAFFSLQCWLSEHAISENDVL